MLLITTLATTLAILAARARPAEELDRLIARRINAMFTAQAALDTLGDMSSGRRPFDRRLARSARRDLVAYMAAIPALFRRQRSSPRSRALPAIWQDRRTFRARARAAERTARGLDVRSLDRLRRDLPEMLGACLSCHRAYRRPP